jgi:suppressor of cytokine signaling 7
MKDLGRWFSQQQRQYLSTEAAEQERLGSRPPLPLPFERNSSHKPSSQDSILSDPLFDVYDRVEPRLLGSNGLELGLRDLSHHGWYWGPLTRQEAEEKLAGYSDGTFLVRDSSDDRYLLSLSFRSQGKTLHTRIEFSNGYFSFYSFPDSDNEGYTSVVELIERSMQYSSVGVFCFSRARALGSPAVPVRLLKPLSRLTHVRSLQHYCRFVIRQSIRYDSIRHLPLPCRVHTFLEQSQY